MHPKSLSQRLSTRRNILFDRGARNVDILLVRYGWDLYFHSIPVRCLLTSFFHHPKLLSSESCVSKLTPRSVNSCSIRKFAAKNVEPVVLVATAYAWLTAMMIIALVPIDVWAAYIMSPATTPIFIMWNIAYWSTQAATWFVLPFYQVYSEAGDFSIKNKYV